MAPHLHPPPTRPFKVTIDGCMSTRADAVSPRGAGKSCQRRLLCHGPRSPPCCITLVICVSHVKASGWHGLLTTVVVLLLELGLVPLTPIPVIVETISSSDRVCRQPDSVDETSHHVQSYDKKTWVICLLHLPRHSCFVLSPRLFVALAEVDVQLEFLRRRSPRRSTSMPNHNVPQSPDSSLGLPQRREPTVQLPSLGPSRQISRRRVRRASILTGTGKPLHTQSAREPRSYFFFSHCRTLSTCNPDNRVTTAA